MVSFKQGHAIITRLIRQAPDNSALLNDLAWLENELAQLDNEASSGRSAQQRPSR